MIDSELKNISNITSKKFFFIVFVIVFAFFLLGLFFYFFLEDTLDCGDGTHSGECSVNKPYYCSNGKLISHSSLCGCSDDLLPEREICMSSYYDNEVKIRLNYTVNGKDDYIDFLMFKDLVDCFADLPRSIEHDSGVYPDRIDFKMKFINNSIQREALVPLVVAIQNKAKSKEEQARIAISLVQNLEYSGLANIGFGFNNIQDIKYPYELLYAGEGICSETSDLLSFLLKELGYGTVIFYYSYENHEAVGIKCPAEYSLRDSGYCYVETTRPAIISDSYIGEVGGVQLKTIPEILFISSGISLDDKMYEYNDAKEFVKLKTENMVFFRKLRFNKLKSKYGLLERM